MRVTYYATRISDNISRTPEGYLLCRNCVLARTGFQTYTVHDVTKDLSEDEINELGLSNSSPNSSINLYRPSTEVFSQATIASAEGKPLTDEHPNEFVNPENFREYVRGHVQNVRKGPEGLDSGDWPLMGDILVTDSEVIDKVENGIRELSCGYSHELALDGDKIRQTNIVVNHVALVRKGRAGPEARINDSAGEIPVEKSSVTERPVDDILKSNRLEKKMAKYKGNVFTRLLGLGIRAMANDEDTSPEELAAATKELHEQTKDEMEGEGGKKGPKCAPGVLGHENCDDAACNYDAGNEEPPAKAKMPPAKAKMPPAKAENPDDRAEQHAMLDRVLDRMGARKEAAPTKDADVEELRNLLNDFFKEEEKEPEHNSNMPSKDEEEEEEDPGMYDAEESEVIEPIAEDSDEKEEELMMKNDAAMNLLSVVEKSRNKVVQKAYDAALENSLEDERKFLSKFRPFVAKSKDASLISAFNGESRRVNGRTQASDASYTGFGQAAKARPKQNDKSPDAYAAIDEAYARILKGEN